MQTGFLFLHTFRHFVMVVCAAVFVIPAGAQQSFYKHFTKTPPVHGGQECNVGVTVGDSSYYVTCLELLAETDLSGNMRWGRQLLYNNNIIYIQSLVSRTGGGYYGAGAAFDVAQLAQNLIIFRLDGLGNTVWSKKILTAVTSSRDVVADQATDGGLGICMVFTTVNGQGGAWVGKTDSLGNLLWSKIIRHGQLTTTRGSKIAATRDGGFVVTSKITISNNPGNHTGLSRLDANGNLLWTKTFSGAGVNDWPNVTQCDDGGFAVAGTGSSGGAEGFRLCRTDSMGNLLWTTCYFAPGDLCYPFKIQETSDHGFILTGAYLNMTSLVTNPLLIRTDSLGDTLWVRKLIYNSFCGSTAFDVEETPDGGFLIPSADFAMIKTDPQGNINCVSFPFQVTCLDTLAGQTSSVDFINGTGIGAAIISNTLLPFTDSLVCAGEFNPTGISETASVSGAVVYPNPSEGLFTLQFENGTSSYDVTVYNAIGQVVRSYKNASTQLLIDLGSADAGIYFVRITSETGKRSSTVRLLKR